MLATLRFFCLWLGKKSLRRRFFFGGLVFEEVLHLKAFLRYEPQHSLRSQTDCDTATMASWRIELFCEVVYVLKKVLTSLGTTANYSHSFSTLHKNYGYQKRKSRNSFIFFVVVDDAFDREACDCESQKYLFYLLSDGIKIVFFFLSSTYVRWNWKPGEIGRRTSSCITRQT